MPLREQAGIGGVLSATGVDREYVQGLLAEIRRLKVELERVKLETREIRARGSKADPRLTALERENQRLREELHRARSERDELEQGVREALAQLRRP